MMTTRKRTVLPVAQQAVRLASPVRARLGQEVLLCTRAMIARQIGLPVCSRSMLHTYVLKNNGGAGSPHGEFFQTWGCYGKGNQWINLHLLYSTAHQHHNVDRENNRSRWDTEQESTSTTRHRFLTSSL